LNKNLHRILNEEQIKKDKVNQKMAEMRRVLDEQIEEKKKVKELERYINCEQARIWKSDLENYKSTNFQKGEDVSQII